MEILVGFKSINNAGEEYEVIEQVEARRYKVRFLRSGFEKVVRKDYITGGSLSDPFTVTKYGIGFIGAGPYKVESDELRPGGLKKKAHPAYTRWNGMLSRCYNTNYSEYVRYGALGTTVDALWHNYQNFAEWFCSRGKLNWTVDKDLLCIGGVKKYSEENCVVVPTYVNNSIVHQKHNTNGLPIGVWWSSNAAASKYTAEMEKKSLGCYKTPMEAHRAWQTAKAKKLEVTLTKYLKEDFVEEKAVKGLVMRIELLYDDHQSGRETITL